MEGSYSKSLPKKIYLLIYATIRNLFFVISLSCLISFLLFPRKFSFLLFLSHEEILEVSQILSLLPKCILRNKDIFRTIAMIDGHTGCQIYWTYSLITYAAKNENKLISKRWGRGNWFDLTEGSVFEKKWIFFILKYNADSKCLTFKNTLNEISILELDDMLFL